MEGFTELLIPLTAINLDHKNFQLPRPLPRISQKLSLPCEFFQVLENNLCR